MNLENNSTDTAALEADVFSVFGFGDSNSDQLPADAPAATEVPAAEAGTPSPAPAAAPAGEVEVAPPPSPAETPSSTPATATPPAALPPLAAPAPAAPAAPPAPDPRDLELADLRARLAAIETSTAQPAAPAAPATPDPLAEAPRYGLSIPPEVTNAVFGDDPVMAKAGLEHMINSLATHIHTNLRTEFTQRLEQVQQTLAAPQAEQARSTAMEQARNKYFEKFPAHKDPNMQPFLKAAADELQREFPNLPWDDTYMAALGARAQAKLDALRPATPPPPPPAPPPAKPAAMLPTAAPRSPLDFDTQDGDVIADTFRWGN